MPLTESDKSAIMLLAIELMKQTTAWAQAHSLLRQGQSTAASLDSTFRECWKTAERMYGGRGT